MAVIRSGAGSSDLTVDATSLAARVTIYDTAGNASGSNALPSPVVQKPLPYGALGHYRVTHRVALANSQAVTSRLFEFRNNAANVMVPTSLVIKWIQTGAHTAAIEDSIDVFRVTGFTVLSTTNITVLTATRKRTTMAAANGGAQVQGSNGNAAGMTGFTAPKDGGPIAQLPLWLTLLFTDPAQRTMAVLDAFDDVNGTHPFALAQNEGIIIENRVALGAAAASTVYIDFQWAEVTAF